MSNPHHLPEIIQQIHSLIITTFHLDDYYSTTLYRVDFTLDIDGELSLLPPNRVCKCKPTNTSLVVVKITYSVNESFLNFSVFSFYYLSTGLCSVGL